MAKPEWRPVMGYEDYYEVSSAGEVRSFPRVVIAREPRGTMGLRYYKGRVLKQTPGKNGYPTVKLSLRGRVKTHLVHSLVAQAFLGPCPAEYEVCHYDGTRNNNRLSNLRYDTRKANAEDRKRHIRERA